MCDDVQACWADDLKSLGVEEMSNWHYINLVRALRWRRVCARTRMPHSSPMLCAALRQVVSV